MRTSVCFQFVFFGVELPHKLSQYCLDLLRGLIFCQTICTFGRFASIWVRHFAHPLGGQNILTHRGIRGLFFFCN